jgi:hypothetical protein
MVYCLKVEGNIPFFKKIEWVVKLNSRRKKASDILKLSSCFLWILAWVT